MGALPVAVWFEQENVTWLRELWTLTLDKGDYFEGVGLGEFKGE